MELDDIETALDGYAGATKTAIERLNKTVAELEKRANRPPGYLFGSHDPERDASDAQRKAFRDYLTKGILSDEVKALSVGTDPDGGFSVVTELARTITKKIYDLSPIRQIARVEPIRADAFEELIDKDEAAAAWVSETQSRGATNTPQLGKLRVPAFEIYANPQATQSILEDSSLDIENWLADKVAGKFARSEGAAFVTGTGTGQPRGFTTYPTAATADASRPWGTIEHVVTGANGAFAASNPSDALLSLVYALRAPYIAGARWVMSRSTAGTIRKFKDGQGLYIWQQSLQAGQPDMLLGFPVSYSEDMPSLATNSLSVAFGNFQKGYVIADRVVMTILRDPYSNKPYVGFYTRKRVGGDMANFEAIKLLKFST